MIAKEAWMFVIPGKILMILLIIAATRFNSYILFGLSILMAALTLFCAFFFRDPERVTPPIPNIMVSPADGEVVFIDSLGHYRHIEGPAIKISIFLSVWNVHINRIPAEGRVDYVKYNPGKFMVAYHEKASEENEQTEIGMTSKSGQKLIFKQIAGIIARRIVYHLNDGDEVAAGDRFGLIRFGSRMDLIFPQDSKIAVKVGDKVVGGETIMGYLADGVAAGAVSTAASEGADD